MRGRVAAPGPVREGVLAAGVAKVPGLSQRGLAPLRQRGALEQNGQVPSAGGQARGPAPTMARPPEATKWAYAIRPDALLRRGYGGQVKPSP